MVRYLVFLGALAITYVQPVNAWPIAAPMLLDMCAAHLEEFKSWRLNCDVLSEAHSPPENDRKTFSRFDLRFDGMRASSRGRTWQGAGATKADRREDEASYLSLLWDGRTYTKYHKPLGNGDGEVMIDDFATADPDTREFEIKSLQYWHYGSCLMGYHPGTFVRIDELLRDANDLRMHDRTESVNGSQCYVIEASTKYGDFILWLDPQHGYAIAKSQVQMSRAVGHLWHGQRLPFEIGSQVFEVIRFSRVSDVWIASEAVQVTEYTINSRSYRNKTHISVTEFVPTPDHEALKSFAPDDIPEGTLTIIVPVTHIRYLWHAGAKLTLHFDKDVVAGIDKTLAQLKDGPREGPHLFMHEAGEDATATQREPNTKVVGTPKEEISSLNPRPHCGLYCLYSILKLSGQDVDFRDLVKPEYYGRLMGSSLAELNQGAKDYGLYAGVVSRLSTRALRDCPYWAILHVRRNLESKEYDHYQLFLGTENGKAKLFNPPEGVKLVKFSDLAPLWDGYALFVSPRPFDVDAIFTADRQRLLLYGVLGCLILVTAHLGRRVWLAMVGNLPRRWTLGLTAGQAGLLALAAVLCGGFYHFANDEGLLANAGATASFQKAYQGGFILRISHKKARELLGMDTVFIDARLAGDYERGHLDGAISVPVDANDIVRRERTAALPKNARIVLYCQSAGCKFAERVGVKLLDDGFANLAIFKGGWMEWTEKYGRPDPNESERRDGSAKD